MFMFLLNLLATVYLVIFLAACLMESCETKERS